MSGETPNDHKSFGVANPKACKNKVWFICVTCRIHQCDMTHVCVWHDSFTYVVTRLTLSWRSSGISKIRSDVSRSYICHDSFTCVSWCVHACDMTHSNVRREAFISVTWLIQMHESCPICMCVMTCVFTRVTWRIYMCGMPRFIRVTWLIHVCDMTHSHLWLDPSIPVTWHIHLCGMTHSYLCLIHMCAMTQSCVCHDSFKCVIWLIHICAMTHSYVCHALFISVPWLSHVCDMTHSYL